MNSPTQLAYPEKLPEDLKVLLLKQKVPFDDPLIAVLAWHWLRMDESGDAIQAGATALKATLDERREAIQDSSLKLQAALDERMKKLTEWTGELETLNGHMVDLTGVLAEKPLAVSKQIEAELTAPLQLCVTHVNRLAGKSAQIVADVDECARRLHRSQIITTFLTGFATGTLIIAWIYSHIFLH